MKDAIRAMARREGHGMATVTNRALPLRLMRRMERLGLVQRAGRVVVCDGDGWAIQPERERDGWTVTRAGMMEVTDDRN